MANDATQWLLQELERVFAPLSVAARDEAARRRLFGRLGWTHSGGGKLDAPALIDALTAIVAASSQAAELGESETTGLEAWGERVDVMFAVSDATRALQNSLQGVPSGADVRQLGNELLELLLTDYLLNYHPTLYHSLSILTVIDPATFYRDDDSVGPNGQVLRRAVPRIRLRPGRAGSLLRGPSDHLRNFYLGQAPIVSEADATRVSDRVFPRVGALLGHWGATVIYGLYPNGRNLNQPNYRLAATSLSAFWDRPGITDLGVTFSYVPEVRGGLGLVVSPFGRLNAQLQIGDWDVAANLGGNLVGFALDGNKATLAPNAAVTFSLASSWRGDWTPFTLLGGRRGTRLDLGRPSGLVELTIADGRAEYGVSGQSIGGALHVDPGEGGILSSILPGSTITIPFDIGMGWSQRTGLYFSGGATLEIRIAIGKKIGPIVVDALNIILTPRTDRLELETSLDTTAAIGPVGLSINRLGLNSNLRFRDGNLGPVDLDLAFKPPTGIGVALDLAAVKGGGYVYLDYARGSYAGALQLAIAELFDLKVVGLIDKVPGSKKLSVLALGSAEFTPAIQLWAGFTLDGVGLMVGIHRSMSTQALSDGARSGALDSLLFPDDPVANAPRIISDLSKMFPPTEGKHVLGVSALLSWAGLNEALSLKVGIGLQVPAPIRAFMAMQGELMLPPKNGEIVALKADLVGTFDQATKRVTIDGSLRDSRVGSFPVSGDTAFRNGKGFILSAGGVYPGFDTPDDFPKLARVGVSLGADDNPRVRIEGYFALTTNTVQAGAHAEIYAKAAGFSLQGWAGLDMLFQFQPFKVFAQLTAGVAIKRGSRSLMSLTLSAEFEGFTPIHIDGRVRFKILFVKVKIPVSLTIGRKSEKRLPPVEIRPDLIAALSNARSWTGGIRKNDTSVVTLAERATGPTLLHPLASFSVRQQVVPLDVKVDLYNGAPPKGDAEYKVTGVWVRGSRSYLTVDSLKDDFAPAQFFEMSDGEKIAAPAFEKYDAGVELSGDGIDFPDAALEAKNMEFETITIDRVRVLEIARYLPLAPAIRKWMTVGTAGRFAAGVGRVNVGRGLQMKVKAQGFVLADTTNLTKHGSTPQPVTYGKARNLLAATGSIKPGARGLQIIGAHEA